MMCPVDGAINVCKRRPFGLIGSAGDQSFLQKGNQYSILNGNSQVRC